MYIKINCNLSTVAEPTVATPPAAPQFDANVIQSLALTNPGGVVAIKLNCTGTSAACSSHPVRLPAQFPSVLATCSHLAACGLYEVPPQVSLWGPDAAGNQSLVATAMLPICSEELGGVPRSR